MFLVEDRHQKYLKACQDHGEVHMIPLVPTLTVAVVHLQYLVVGMSTHTHMFMVTRRAYLTLIDKDKSPEVPFKESLCHRGDYSSEC